jgi:HEAT repeat protein
MNIQDALDCMAGSEMTKILMASALARMELTEQSKRVVAMEGAIPPLVKMISNGKLEARTAALGALLKLSTHPENRDPLISAGVIPPLLQLLFSVTSVRMNLKETASETLANLATAAPLGFGTTAHSSILDSEETIYQLLSLLNLVGPDIQGHLLSALHGMASPPTAISVRAKMRSGGAIQLLLPFCETNNPGVRVNAVKLLYSLSQDGMGKELVEHIGENHIRAFVSLINCSREDEKAAAAGIISNLPYNDSQVTEMLYVANALPALVELLRVGGESVSSSRTYRYRLMEAAARAMVRFTLPLDVRMQRLAVEQDVMPLLVRVLSRGSHLAKKEAAIVLSQLSENSKKLSTPPDSRAKWCCFSFSQPGSVCIVHQGHCSVRGSFCLIHAEAIDPLVRLLGEDDDEAQEAALSALSTLIKDDLDMEKGMQVIDEVQGLKAIVRLLAVGNHSVKEKACWMLERFFRFEKYSSSYGAQAQMPLIDLAQRGTLGTKSLAAKCLAHLKVLPNQSTYF